MKRLLKSIINRIFNSKVKVVENKERKFGSAKEYYQIDVVCENGSNESLLFTKDEVNTAIERSKKNNEELK
jgi:hypothetical protein